MTIRACAGKGIPVLSKNDDGAVLFRMMRDVRKILDAHAVLRVTLENGASFRVAPEQILYRADERPVAASSLVPGAPLLPAFSYPRAYEYRTDEGEDRTSDQALKVLRVEAGGEAELYAFEVNQTGRFFLAAGVLCAAEGGA